MAERKTALVVDDESMLRELLRHVLEMRGYEVTGAQDGEVAVETFRNTSFDIVLLDIAMPRMDGLEALGHIRAMNAHVPVILISGHAGIEEQRRGEGLGAVLLRKPFSIQVLQGLLELVETGQSLLSDATSRNVIPIGSGRDRRRFARADVDLPALVREVGTSEFLPSRITDISLGGGGVRFTVVTHFPIGVHIDMVIEDAPRPDLVITAEVVWTDGETRCGARFGPLTESQSEQIENIVARRLVPGTGEQR